MEVACCIKREVAKKTLQLSGSYRKLAGRFPEADKEFVVQAWLLYLIFLLLRSLFQTSFLEREIGNTWWTYYDGYYYSDLKQTFLSKLVASKMMSAQR